MRNRGEATRKVASRRRGQAFTEYLIIVALVGVGAIGAISKFGSALARATNAATARLDVVGKKIDRMGKFSKAPAPSTTVGGSSAVIGAAPHAGTLAGGKLPRADGSTGDAGP